MSADLPEPGTPPVVVAGTHRSGTTLVIRLLDRLGLFVGARVEENHEAILFQELNRWVLRQSGASWDRPSGVHQLLDHSEARGLAREHLRDVLESLRRSSYLGWGPTLRGQRLGGLRRPWGWKDPRNVFTLPLWLELFPAARVVHVKRHGVDVARSLQVREERTFDRLSAQYRRRGRLNALRKRSGGFLNSVRCAELEGGFSLWEEYMAEAAGHAAGLGERWHEVRYEELLRRPAEVLLPLAAFAGLEVTPDEIGRATPDLDAGRAYAHRGSAELTGFAARMAERLAAYGYAEGTDG